MTADGRGAVVSHRTSGLAAAAADDDDVDVGDGEEAPDVVDYVEDDLPTT